MKKYVLGIDLGGMSAKCALVNDGKLYGHNRCKTDKSCTPRETVAQLVDLAEKTLRTVGVGKDEIKSVGIGAPGIVNSKSGIVVSWTNFGWNNVPLMYLMSEGLGLPVSILNDANAAALGEYTYGAGKEFRSTVMITIGTGIGSGIVKDGTVWEGNFGTGGEIGHTVIESNGEQCSCGRNGCFERYASVSALIRQTKRAMEQHPESLLWKVCNDDIDNVNGKTAFEGMRKDDKTAAAVIDRYLHYLSEGITNVVNIFGPEAVILGGGISAEGETLIEPIRKTVNEQKLGGELSASVKIVTATLGNDAGIYGAAEYADRREI